MKFYYSAWVGERDGQNVFGASITVEDHYLHITKLIATLINSGYHAPNILSFQVMEPEHVEMILGVEGRRSLEDGYRRNKIKPV